MKFEFLEQANGNYIKKGWRAGRVDDKRKADEKSEIKTIGTRIYFTAAFTNENYFQQNYKIPVFSP